MKILWIRHAYSCGNLYMNLEKIGEEEIPAKQFRDARLTDYASTQTKGYWNKILKPKLKTMGLKPTKYVFTSTLTRAIETADQIAPSNYGIVPISYISEINMGWYHREYNLPRNRKKVEKDLGYEFQVFQRNNPYRTSGEPKHNKPDRKLFFEYGLPSLIKSLESQGVKITKDSVIVIVSHGGFIQTVTGKKVGNLGAVLQTLPTNKFKTLFKGYKNPSASKLGDGGSNCFKKY